MTLNLKSTTALAAAIALTGSTAWAGMEEAMEFLETEIAEMTALSPEEQEAEMQWFIDAAEPFQGMEIKVVSETITTHEYESQVLAPAFTAITGIQVTHDLIGEGDVVEKLQTQMQSGENIYDAYVNDSDLIGTHWRYQQVRNLTDWMDGEGADVTSPNLDLDDFIGTQFTTAPDGKLYQLPDQQFANLYWFRYDWFNDDKNKTDFQDEYGYELGVPVNWAAYEDIAEFFTGRDLSHMGVEGEIFDAAVDLRVGSPTEGELITRTLDAVSGAALYLPPGLAHGFQALSAEAVVVYRVTSVHSPDHDGGIRWDSAGIDWPREDAIVSERDAALPALADFESPFRHGG